eukprot:6124212-Karenia_brevis.AAC.1
MTTCVASDVKRSKCTFAWVCNWQMLKTKISSGWASIGTRLQLTRTRMQTFSQRIIKSCICYKH